MTEVQRYCMRCARPAVRGDSETEEIWRCPTQHGIVYKAPLAERPPEAEPAALPEPDEDAEQEHQEEEEAEGEEAGQPEARARAPAVRHRRAPPAAKRQAPKKK